MAARGHGEECTKSLKLFFVIYLPAFDCDTVLSRWTGRPHGMTIDPIGVECFVMPPARRTLLGRRREASEPSAYLHVLVHDELSSDRIRSWATSQVARLAALANQPDAEGDLLNRLAAEAQESLMDREWTPQALVVDGHVHPGSAFVAEPLRWAAYLELGADRVALVGSGLTPEEAPLRTATGDEARALRTDALRV